MSTRARRALVLVALALVLLGSAGLFVRRWHFMVDQPPVDFELNWVAANRIVHHRPLYDRTASRADGFRLVGDSLIPDFSSGGTYASYIGTPATALFYTPFVPFGHDRAVELYRIAQAMLMLAAIVITGFALPRRSRLVGWAVGAAAFLIFYPVQESIGLGQVDGFIMCALAIGLWALSRERPHVAGASLGVATLLKISPGLLLIYLVLRGVKEVILPAVATAAGLLVVAAVVGRPGDLVTWTTDVLPKLSRGGLLVNNQSLPAWLARLFGSDLGWLSLDADLGRWRVVAPLVVVGGIAALYLARRHRPFALLELGVVIFIALLAGPISWDHYPTWGILALMLMADGVWWVGRRKLETVGLLIALGAATVLMYKLTQYPTPDVIAADWTRRVESGSKTIGLLAYTAVATWLLVTARPRTVPSERRSPGDVSVRRRH